MLDHPADQPNPAPVHCVSFGVPFRLSTDDPSLLPAMINVLPYQTEISQDEIPEAEPFHIATPHEGCAFRLRSHGAVTLEHNDLPPILERLGQDLMVHVANHAPDRVFVHAGVVGWHGRAIVIPGRSFAGKTTLVAELVKAGATYYSDEYAVLDDDGRVHPYARELQMRQPSNPEQRSVPIETLNGIAGVLPLPVVQVIFTEYQPGAAWKPEPVSAGMAVLEMLRHTIPIQRTPARAMATLTRMMRDAKAWQSQRGEAQAAVAALLESALQESRR